MKKIVKTPLAVVYVDEKKNLRISENLDLCRVSEVWGVFLYMEIGKLNVFISKSNGPDLTLKEAGDWADKHYEPYYNLKYDNFLYGGLPHMEEILVLMMGYVEMVNKTMSIFRENGIAADNLFDDFYLVYSDKAFSGANDLHIRRIMQQKSLGEASMYQALRTDDGGETVLEFDAEKSDDFTRYHTRLFLHYV